MAMCNRAVVWDLDDTLYQQSQQFLHATQSIAPYAAIDEQIGYTTFKKYSEQTYLECEQGMYDVDEMRIRRIQLTMRELGYEITRKEAIEWQMHYIRQQSSIQLCKEMEEILYFLKNNHVEQGLISNGPNEHQRMKLHALGIQRWIPDDYVVISGDLSISKPDLRIFQQLKQKMPHVDQFIYVGDNYVNDILPSCQMGWSAIWFNYCGAQTVPADSVSHHTVTSYTELLTLLESLIH